ncbi:MAG: CaiB/BaiF CoA-transferase family protein [Pseudomonadota bacterium]
MAGPLNGLRIIEFAGIGPGPFCGMMLADHGAEVIRIDRIGAFTAPTDPLLRSRKSIAINTRTPEGVALAKDLVKTADGIIEGFRPGVMERLGLGPDDLLAVNPKLVYGRMTGWGQTGPYAPYAGHDINYIALSGSLHASGRAGEKPTPACNFVGDFGGGAMMLAFGIVSALLSVKNGADGQVIDCAMTDGSALLASMIYGFKDAGFWTDQRGDNVIDTGAHFYDTYETSDGRHIALGAIEPQFYAEFRERVGLDDPAYDQQMDKENWPALKDKLADVFRTKTRDEWCAILEHTDACFAPVLSLEEAPQHPHNVERETFTKVGPFVQPAPAPRYSGTMTSAPTPPPTTGSDSEALLAELGQSDAYQDYKDRGIIG